MDLPQEGSHIGHQAECDGIIAADFLGVDVDMNEFRRRDGEGVAGNPGTRSAIVEAHAHRQQYVGLARGVIGLIVTGAGDETERQRMIAVDRAKAAGRRRHRNLQAFGELEQFLGRAAVAHALANDHHRPLGTEQHVDGLDHAFGIGAAAARYIAVPG